jgi:hypothetical protein
MSEITPITREEKLWNGEDLEPLTREEMYIKRIFDKTQTIPDKPLTRKEILMEKAGEGGGGDVTIKQLSVTANGTYSEEGTAYSPVNVAVPLAEKSVTENGTYNASDDSVAGYSKVNVNVPLPENAYLLKEASGSLVSFNDGADLPMPSFVCDIDAVQDLHGYDAPWVGGSGKNKLPNTASNETVSGVTFTVNSDGTITANGTASNLIFFQIGIYSLPTSETPISYVLSGAPSGASTSTFYIDCRRDDGSQVIDVGGGSIPFSSLGQTGKQARIIIQQGQTLNNLVFKPMIRLATETDPTYAPYSNICPISGHTGVEAVISPTTEASDGTTYSVSWQTEAGEVYGGEIDLVSGVLTVTHKEITFDGVTEGKMFTNKSGGSSPNYFLSLYDGYLFGKNEVGWVSVDEMQEQGMINSHYDYFNLYTGFRAYVGDNLTASQPRLFFGPDSTITTIDLANQWLATQYANGTPWQVKYPLATPITYQLSPQQIKSLLGSNNIWCDTGDVDVEYFGKGE